MSSSAAKTFASRSSAFTAGSRPTSSARQKTGASVPFEALADPVAELVREREAAALAATRGVQEHAPLRREEQARDVQVAPR